MTFPTPTSVQEMYNILGDIFHYYRHQPLVYTGSELVQIDLERLNYTLPSDQEYHDLARTLLLPTQLREKAQKQKEILTKIDALSTSLLALPNKQKTLIAEATSSYEKGVASVQNNAKKNGATYSDTISSKIASLVSEKNRATQQIISDIEKERQDLQSQISSLQTELSKLDEFFEPIYQSEINAKAEELKAEGKKIEREVFKYNNSLDIREQEYANNIVRSNATLELQYLEIRSKPYSKDELVTMGYYRAVIDCVCSYYDQLAPVYAYEQIVDEPSLTIYLDDFYQDLVFMYKSRIL